MERLVDDITYPNGLAFSPDESILYVYVVDSQGQQLLAFAVYDDGSVGKGRLHIDMRHPQTGFYSGGPDGMKVDVAGNLYITGTDGIWVYQADGIWLGKLTARSDQRHAEPAANLAWGGADRMTLFVTACSSLYRFRMKIAGAG